MSKIIGYGLIMFVFGYLARCVEQAFKAIEIRRYAELAKTPNETIECTYATVLVDNKGNISWFRNDNLNLLKKNKGDDNNA